jgi:hypothetical protein
VNVFHRTDAGPAILDKGFRDAEGTFMTAERYVGVWVSDRRLDCNEGAEGEAVLTVDIGEADFSEWEWAEEGNPYREWLAPAEVLNLYPVTEVRDAS